MPLPNQEGTSVITIVNPSTNQIVAAGYFTIAVVRQTTPPITHNP
jgi:hypothetical protein